MTPISSTSSIMHDIMADIHDPALLWQIVPIALALWFASRRARLIWAAWQPRLAQARSGQGWTSVQADALVRLLFPLIAAVLLALIKPVLGLFTKTQLVSLALVLVFALALIRMIVYAVSRVARSAAIVAFERTLVAVVWLGVLLYVSGHWIEVVDVLEATKLTIGKQTVTLWTLATGLFWTVLTVFVSVWLGGFIEARLLGNSALDASLGAMLGRLIRALLLVAGLLVGLTLVGLDLTALSVFGGALGVGIGLGLQRIASNYISGFIVLFERMIRIGDVIRVDQLSGQVREIRTRFTVLRSGDGVDQIVPNELLTAQAVLNSTTSGLATVKMPLTLAASADVSQATTLALRALEGIARVEATPAPQVFFRGWTLDGLVIELIFSVSEPNKGSDSVRSDVLQRIWALWRDAGVPVPFMQRETLPGTARMITLNVDQGPSNPASSPAGPGNR